MNNLIRAALAVDVADEDMDDYLYNEFDLGPEDFVARLIKGLVPLIEVGKLELSGKTCKGFTVDGVFECKIACD